MSEEPPSRLFPLLVMGAAVALGLLLWLAFPAIQAWIARQDCVATGRTNCG